MSAPVLVFVVCALACVVANVAILLSSERARSTATLNVPRPHAAAELVWALVPVVALAIVLTATWARVRERDASRPQEIIKVAQ